MNIPDWEVISRWRLKYREYEIVVKQDFGREFFVIDGMPCMWGYVVVKDGCNVMPGAVWFQTVKAAKDAIDILIFSGGAGNSTGFWRTLRSYIDQRAQHRAKLIESITGWERP